MTTSIDEAKALMDLVGTPSALVTGTFLAFVGKSLKENVEDVNHVRMTFATLAALAALGVASSLAWLLFPFARDVGFRYEGHVEATFVVFWMITLSAVGTACYCAYTLFRCVKELKRPSQ